MRRSLTGSLDAGSSNRSDIQRIATFQTLAAGIMGKQEFIDVALFLAILSKKLRAIKIKHIYYVLLRDAVMCCGAFFMIILWLVRTL